MTREMHDKVFRNFLESQYQKITELNESSDIVQVFHREEHPCRLYAVRFFCKGLIKENGNVREHNEFSIGIFLHDDYLRICDPLKTVTWLGPGNIFHPNIKAPYICVGRIAPGTEVVELIDRVFQVITYQKVTMIEENALNGEACQWARAHTDRFPVDKRPIRRRRIEFRIEEIKKEAKE